jgi:putative NIF3 family GTP cyclohydrolase 1 type 2
MKSINNQNSRRAFVKTGMSAAAGLSLLPGQVISQSLMPVGGKVTPRDIMKWIVELKGWDMTHEEGVHHGSPDTEIKSITVCWKASPGAIEEAGKRGDNLIIGHESLHYPYYFDFDPERTPGWEEWKINTQRMERLDKYGITYLRLHVSIDFLTIAREMGRWMELGEPIEVEGGTKVYEIEECTLQQLVTKVKRLSGIPAIRVSAPHGFDHRVKRVGLLVGGAALVPNGFAFEPGVRAGVDVFIAGETDNYGFRYASEMGISLIETSHEVCENPGFRVFAGMVREKYPDLRVSFYENKCPYVVV